VNPSDAFRDDLRLTNETIASNNRTTEKLQVNLALRVKLFIAIELLSIYAISGIQVLVRLKSIELLKRYRKASPNLKINFIAQTRAGRRRAMYTGNRNQWPRSTKSQLPARHKYAFVIGIKEGRIIIA
jgi:hypothetical protein